MRGESTQRRTRQRVGLASIVAASVAVVAVAALDASPSPTGRRPRSPAERQPSRLDLPAEPQARGLELVTEPQDGFGFVPALISSARRSVEMTMYELADRRVEAALARTSGRGVRVRVLLDRGGGFPARENEVAAAYLRARGVAVRYATSAYPLTHEKSIEIDGRVALIATFNLTSRYYAVDRDFGVLDRRRRAVAAIEAAFASDWVAAARCDRGLPRRPVTNCTPHGQPPPRARALVWSPGAEAALLRLVAGARRTLQLESEELSDPRIATALCAAAQRGVEVQVTLPHDASPARMLARLARCGDRVRVHPASSLYIHAKAIVVDGTRAFVGSQNLSTESLSYNRELGIVFDAKPLVASLSATLASDFAGAHSIARR
jgi:cardiolipin synthase A/B